jgi:tRNA nucleotidyltransferase (CCA-adding enzyme)
MHMLHGPDPTDILAEEAEAAAQLRHRLAVNQWPLSIDHLPADAALVGGAVRDGLLDRLADRPDLDLVVAEDAIELCRRLARRHGGSCVVLDEQRSIARLVLRGWTVDLARRCGTDLASDLRRRDYTINAIALPLEAGASLLDPTGGLADLRQRQLVAVSEANLLDDPLRLLRGVRLAAELEFRLSAATRRWLVAHHHRLASVACERVLTELEKLAAAPAGHRGLITAMELQLLQPWQADAAGAARLAGLDEEGAVARGLNREERGWALPLARLAALLDGGAVARLHGSRRLQQRCERLNRWRVALEARSAGKGCGSLKTLQEPERLRLHQELEETLPALLLLLPEATARQAMERWHDPHDPLFHPRPPIDGRQLQELLAIPAGPRLGELLAVLTRERAYQRLPEASQQSTSGLDPQSAAAAEPIVQLARKWWQQAEAGEEGRRAADRRHD